ncbi:hypothetical protein NC652_013872 [Populus alba x Populus x berolinensis]|nr:hypothetical protein NC652_013872 [Populus alba x Populus x berolinensis]
MSISFFKLKSEKNSHAAVAGIQGWFSILKRDQPYKLILQNVMPDLSTQGQVYQSHGGHILLKAHIAGFGSVHLPGMTISAFYTIGIPICTKDWLQGNERIVSLFMLLVMKSRSILLRFWIVCFLLGI